tara:strand:+ start:2282 stop:4141 length:1860 start_codon:yes stop_codon:yes gene_type:complete
MNLENTILSDVTVHMKYAKYLEASKRRENWKDITTRNMAMHIEKFPHLEDEIRSAYVYVFNKKVLPSMRSLQFGGKPIKVAPNRIFNCAFAPIDDARVFGEIMFLLLGGTGVGFSVQKHHVEKLPEIRRPNTNRNRRFLIGDSIEGWSDAVRALINSYFKGTSKLRFDFSDIRAKGMRLVTSGGKAPGPQPLKECLVKVEGILDGKQNGDKLSTIEVHDIICYIADAVLAGGIRRAALISLFSANDEEMLGSKAGSWWELNPQRGRANNSVVLLRHKITEESFKFVWKRIEESKSGEPGFVLSNDRDWGVNPCVEIGLRPNQFCNLVEINVSDVTTQEELNARSRAASFIATLQASYTDFHYLRPIWKRTTEKEALIGVSMTGIASGGVLKLSMTESSLEVNKENRRVAMQIGINKAARTTCVKPAGSTSLTLGTSSGIHAWHAEYYIRRLRVGKNESIYGYLLDNIPGLLEDDKFRPHDTAIISIPQSAPDGAILRSETAIDLLERVKKVSMEWVKGGHQTGSNGHNVSATISIKSDEWAEVGQWMWENREYYNGLSVLPYNDHSYVQAPFEECSKEKYEEMLKLVKGINLDKVIEVDDQTNLSGEIACGGGGSCEII